MEYSHSSTNIKNRKQRLLPLNLEIIRIMQHFSSSTSSIIGCPILDEFGNKVSEEVRKAVVTALKSVPFIDQLINAESLTKIINKCMCVDGLNPNNSNLNEQNSNESFKKSASKKSVLSDGQNSGECSNRNVNANLHSWILLKHSVDILKQRIKDLENKIISILNGIPEWKQLKINQVNLNIEAVVDNLETYIDKSFCQALKSAVDEKYKTLQDLKCLPKKSDLQIIPNQETLNVVENRKVPISHTKVDEKNDSQHLEGPTNDKSESIEKHEPDKKNNDENIQTIPIIVKPEERHPVKQLCEHQRLIYERVQYDLNTNFFLKSDTSVSLNERQFFNLRKTAILPFSTDKNPLVQLMNKNRKACHVSSSDSA